MPSPYRETDNAPPAPLAELRWRRRVATSARWAAVLLVIALFVAPGPLPPFALTVASIVLGTGASIATWTLTSRMPGGRVGWAGWLLRVSLPAFLVVTGLALPGAGSQASWYVPGVRVALGMLVLLSGMAHLETSRRRRPGQLASWMVGFLILGLFALLESWSAFPAFLFLAAFVFEALRQQMLPVEQQWWFDNQTDTPSEWVALLVFRSKQAQVLRMNEKPGSFPSQDKATEWLEANGYVPAERAIEERLVDRAPPDVLKVRARKKLRSASMSPQPRVRVAPEPSDDTAEEAADGASHEMDENAPPDEPDPPRAVANHDPHDPRT